MEGNYKPYRYLDSIERIGEILAQPSGQYEEVESLPSRDTLTFMNGFYATSTAVFVDIRDSSKLPEAYLRPVLAKIYRSFISEAVAILNSSATVREVNIVGDCVWAVYNTKTKPELDAVFELCCQLNALENVLALKMKKAGYETPVFFGIGIADGRALMIKAGLTGSAINDVVYMGDVVNKAAYLASLGGKTTSQWSKSRTARIYMDEPFQQNLKGDYQALTSKVQSYPEVLYMSDAYDSWMMDWVKQNE